MQARFALGTFKRIAAVLGEDEDRTDFVRAAVERELRHREAAKSAAANFRRRAPKLPPTYSRGGSKDRRLGRR